MIARTCPTWQTSDWQNELAQAIRDPEELLKRLNLSQEQLPAMRQASEQFPLRVTESYLSRIRPGDPQDPLLLQILPKGDELLAVEGFGRNPVGDQQAMAVPGLLHKYHGRCLLIATAACALHCRYCFRRHFPYQESRLDSLSLQRALDYITADNTLEEVILSGGDPLSLSDQRLEELISQLESISHVKRLRIHTRQPVALPSRITNPLLSLLTRSRLQIVMVLHFNHANEFNQEVATAMERLANSRITLLNQSVLLKGVNDRVDILKKLSNTLFDNGIIPYYIHLLDKVAGAAHFDIKENEAKMLLEKLRAELPGYLVPQLVRETPGEPNKTPVIQ